MPVLTDLATDLRVVSRRAASTAVTALDASFHLLRTVREGKRFVRGLLTPDPEEPFPSPRDAAETTENAAGNAVEDTENIQNAEDIADDDRPVESRGPAPHVPPAIAGEIERDYGDEIPGIRSAR